MLPWILLAIVFFCALLALFAAAAFFFDFAIRRPKIGTTLADVENPLSGDDPWRRAARKGIALMRVLPKEELFETSHDGLRLHGTLFPAEQETTRTVLAIHGYKNTGWREYSLFIDFYHSLGLNVLIPDDRAHGQSEGNYIGFGNLDREDCIMWARYLAKRYGPASKILLQGVSMGASTVLSASAGGLPAQVKGIVSDCGFTSAWEEFAHELKRRYRLPAFPVLHLSELICKLRAGYGFKKGSPLEQVARATLPILFIHGEDDDFVPTEMVFRLYAACPTQKQLLTVPNAKHAQSMLIAPDLYQKAVREFLAHLDF